MMVPRQIRPMIHQRSPLICFILGGEVGPVHRQAPLKSSVFPADICDSHKKSVSLRELFPTWLRSVDCLSVSHSTIKGSRGSPVAVRRLPMGVNLSGRGTLTGRARCLSDIARSGAGNVHARVAKSDPRAPRRRSRSQQCIFALDYGKLWASGTTDREDAIPPSAGSVGCYAAEGRHAS